MNNSLSHFNPVESHPSQLQYEMQFGEPDAFSSNALSPDPSFHHNLIPYITESELKRIGNYLSTSIKSDDEDRKKWLRILTQGIEQLGLGMERSPSIGSDRDTDLYATTFLTECLKITSKLFSIFFPSREFSQTKIYGYVNKMIEDQAYRNCEFFHYYTNDVMVEYIPDSERSIWWSVLAGSSFIKPYFDVHKGRIVAPYIMPQDIIISSGASSIYDAERITHRFAMTKREMEANFRKNIWFKGYIEEATSITDPVLRKVNAVMGTEVSNSEDNEKYIFDECYTYLKIDGFEPLDEYGPTSQHLPYRITKDSNSDRIVGIWRNFKENDALFRPIKRIIQRRYFTGFNAYGLGMIHLTLGSARTETKIQQQMLKGAVLSNMPNLIQKSGLRTENNQLNFTPGSIPQVTTFGEPLQNVFMPIPFTPPAPIMMDLKNACSTDIQNVSIARELKVDMIPANTSATTILGILSTTNDMPNSLIKSYCRSFTEEFQLIYDLLGETLPDEPYPFLTPGGQHVTMRSDFTPNIRIKPLMDPANSSQTMQLMTNEVLMSLASANPTLYNQREVQKIVLGTLKISDVDSLLAPDPTVIPPPPELDPISENMYAAQGNPIKVFKTQDHKSHNIVHQDDVMRLTNDQTKDNSAVVAALTAHMAQHDMWAYVAEMEAKMGQALPDDASQLPPEIQNEIAMNAARVIDQQQQQQAQQTPPIMDPSIVLMEENRVKEKGIDMEAQYKHEQLQTEQMKIQKDAELKDAELHIKLRQLEVEEKKILLEEKKLMILEKDNDARRQLDWEKIQLDKQKADLQIQAKAFGDTLRYENDSNNDIDVMKMKMDKEKSDLQIQSKAFDTVMAHENEKRSDNLKNPEEE